MLNLPRIGYGIGSGFGGSVELEPKATFRSRLRQNVNRNKGLLTLFLFPPSVVPLGTFDAWNKSAHFSQIKSVA